MFLIVQTGYDVKIKLEKSTERLPEHVRLLYEFHHYEREFIYTCPSL